MLSLGADDKKDKIMKKIFLLLALCLGFTAADAQITTGETTSQVIRNGNRAQQGNFGIYLGATTDMFKNLFKGGPTEMQCLPLINLKYMYTDNLEFRVGLEWYKKNTTESPSEGDDYKEKESNFKFAPGVAYHFNNKNLLDVYVGGEIPFGWGSNGTESNGQDVTASNFNIGLGAFIGLQAYIANLPIAIGMEYGISTAYNKWSDCRYTRDDNTINSSTETYAAKDFDTKRFEIGHQVRFTLSYYFNL